MTDSLLLLRHFELCSRSKITDEGVKKLAKLKDLEHLDLSYNELITNEGFVPIAAKGKLKRLILHYTNVTDSLISIILTPCHQLELLDLSFCDNIGELAFHTLQEMFDCTEHRRKLTVIMLETGYVKKCDVQSPNHIIRNLTIIFKGNFLGRNICRSYEENPHNYKIDDHYDEEEHDWWEYPDECYVNSDYGESDESSETDDSA